MSPSGAPHRVVVPAARPTLASGPGATAAHLVEDLRAFIGIPSISSDPRHARDVRRCAAWLAGRLRRAGLDDVALLPTVGHPVVRAAWRRRPGRPTILIYGHYDVQPAGSPAAWRTPPFQPTIQGDFLFGRGASDDKGPLFAHVAALEWWLATTGALPLNVICLFEGEEEIGSAHLLDLLARRPDLCPADAAVISDTPMLSPGRPAITYGLRGLVSLDLVVRGPARPLHPGRFGGAVHGAADALAAVVAHLHDPDGRVAVPGFYQRVQAVAAGERVALARGGAADCALLAGASRPWGEPGFGPAERTTIRPALTVTALAANEPTTTAVAGGGEGAGRAAAIPAAARARLDVRLVPDQEPGEMARLIQRFVAAQAPPTVEVAVHTLALAPPVLLDRHHPIMAAATAACRRGFGAAPVFVRTGGTIPVVGYLHRRMPVVLLGFSLPDDHEHAPNERLHLPTFRRGVATAATFLAEAAKWLGP